jgi:hypothetical protein
VQDRPEIDYERLLPVDTTAGQATGIVDFRGECVGPILGATAAAATAVDVSSMIDTEALPAFEPGTGRISGGLADPDDQSLVARLRLKTG